jgi:hypothetical protein
MLTPSRLPNYVSFVHLLIVLLVNLQAWFIAGIFVLLALPVTVYEVAMQLEYFSRPKLQIRVIRILWMVPIYALDSWFALRFKASTLPLKGPFAAQLIFRSLQLLCRSSTPVNVGIEAWCSF